MKAATTWTAVAAVALAVGAGACTGGSKSTAPLRTTTTLAAPPQATTSIPPGQAVTTPSAAATAPATSARPAPTIPSSTPATVFTPPDPAAMIAGITAQMNKAQSAPSGAQSQAQARAVIDELFKRMGVPIPKQ